MFKAIHLILVVRKMILKYNPEKRELKKEVPMQHET